MPASNNSILFKKTYNKPKVHKSSIETSSEYSGRFLDLTKKKYISIFLKSGLCLVDLAEIVSTYTLVG